VKLHNTTVTADVRNVVILGGHRSRTVNYVSQVNITAIYLRAQLVVALCYINALSVSIALGPILSWLSTSAKTKLEDGKVV